MTIQNASFSKNQELTPWSDNLLPVIPVDYLEHTEGRPFCTDESCECREDQDAINDLHQQYQDGLASRDDVDRIYHGRTV